MIPKLNVEVDWGSTISSARTNILFLIRFKGDPDRILDSYVILVPAQVLSVLTLD